MLHWLIQCRVAIPRQHRGHCHLEAGECARKAHAVRGEGVVSAGNCVDFFHDKQLTKGEVSAVRQ